VRVLFVHPSDVFERWRRLGLNYMFLGMEALDEAGLDPFRKRVSPDENFQALEVGRKFGLTVAINLISARTGTPSSSPWHASGRCPYPRS